MSWLTTITSTDRVPSTSALKNRRCAGSVMTKPPLFSVQLPSNSGTSSSATAAAGAVKKRARRERLMDIPWAMGDGEVRGVEGGARGGLPAGGSRRTGDRSRNISLRFARSRQAPSREFITTAQGPVRPPGRAAIPRLAGGRSSATIADSVSRNPRR